MSESSEPPLSPKVIDFGRSRRGRNSKLNQTMYGDLSKMIPKRQLKGDNGEEKCHCGGARSDAIKCLEGLISSSEPTEIIEKKRECAREILGNTLLLR